MPDPVVVGGGTFVALALAGLAAFATGRIVAGPTHERVLTLLDNLTKALERRNDIDEALMRELLDERKRRRA